MAIADRDIGTIFASTLDGSAYTEPAVLDREHERIFEREWVFAARTDRLQQAGDVVGCTVGRESVIIVRGRDDVLRGFLNVCRHRGARLCLDDGGNAGKAIRCPYHAWSYSLDGKLITAPNWSAMASMDKAARGLIPVHVETWNGLIWVSLHDDPAPLDEQLRPQLDYRLGGDLSVLDRYDIGSLVLGRRIVYEVSANWKLIMENFQECYHCGTIHPELVDAIPEFQDADIATDGYNTDGYAFADGRDGFTLSGRRRLPRLPGLVDGDDRKYFGMVLRPNAFVSLTPDHVITHRFEPISPSHTRAVCDWLFPRQVVESGQPEVDAAIDDAVALFDAVNNQDFDAAQWCQPNMASRAYRRGGVLAPSEQLMIGRWYEWYHGLMVHQ